MIQPILSPPSPEDMARLAEVDRLVAEAHAKVEEAMALLLAGGSGQVGGDEGNVNAVRYMNEWQNLSGWLEASPVRAFHYAVRNEWTGGQLSGPGTQNVVRWPVDFGDRISE